MEDSIEFGEKHGEHGCWYVECGGEDDADVAHSHLIDFRVINDFNEEGGESSEEREIWLGKPVNEDVISSYLFWLLGEV